MSESVKVQIENQDFRLNPNNELRFEVNNKNEKVVLKLKNGEAEIFGTKLVKGKLYTFYFGAKIAVFTWHGCSLKLRGKKGISYISKETPMMVYLYCHVLLEQLRSTSENKKIRGPVTMVVGPTDVSKSTLCRILLNYSTRVISPGHRPIYVNLDPSQGEISVPGTIGAVMVEKAAEVEASFSQAVPLVYHYGHTNISINSTLYNTLVSHMAKVIHQRMEDNFRIRKNILKRYELGMEFTKSWLSCNSSLLLTKLIQHHTVVERSNKFRLESREARIREFFYGNPRNVLHPHLCEVSFSDIKVYRIGVPSIPNTLMPLDMQKTDLETKLEPVTPGPNMMHHILALSFSTTVEDVVRTSATDFVCVTNVDTSRQMLTLLSPQPKPLPETIYLMSDVQFMDNNA
ncbi:protein CLP1 homolog [Rhopalosiphum padi]|uniref:protein CLP1 homolog n=1 Tax=Rhopalosiphum padi TaxID=40932 RepID=UPI00298E3F65|nr:protein CLP1 homolog [Rhopalosiphum padi]